MHSNVNPNMAPNMMSVPNMGYPTNMYGQPTLSAPHVGNMPGHSAVDAYRQYQAQQAMKEQQEQMRQQQEMMRQEMMRQEMMRQEMMRRSNPYGNANMAYGNPNPYAGHGMSGGMIQNGVTFGTPSTPTPAPYGTPIQGGYSPQGPSQTGEWNKYRPRTSGTSTTTQQPVPGATVPSYQPGQPMNHYREEAEKRQNIVNNTITDSDFADLVRRVEELEYQNLQLKEEVTMLTMIINKNSKHPHLIGNSESKSIREEKVINPDGSLTYTLFGSGNKNEEPEVFEVTNHVPRITKRDGTDVVAFTVDPVQNTSTEINNIIGVGEAISTDVMNGFVRSEDDHSLYRHCVKVGQTIVSNGSNQIIDNIENEYIRRMNEQSSKDVVEGEEKESKGTKTPEDKRQEIINGISKDVAAEINMYLSTINNARGIVGIANALNNIKFEIESFTAKYMSMDVIEALQHRYMTAYNDFIKNNLGIDQDALLDFTPRGVQEADILFRGEHPNVPRSPEEIRKYVEGLEDLLAEFSLGMRLLQTNIDVIDEGNIVKVSYLVKIITSGRVYSYLPTKREVVAELINKSSGTNVVTKESHKLLFDIISTCIETEGDIHMNHNGNYVNSLYVRVATMNNDICVVFKVYKALNSKRPIYVIRKVYESA